MRYTTEVTKVKQIILTFVRKLRIASLCLTDGFTPPCAARCGAPLWGAVGHRRPGARSRLWGAGRWAMPLAYEGKLSLKNSSNLISLWSAMPRASDWCDGF